MPPVRGTLKIQLLALPLLLHRCYALKKANFHDILIYSKTEAKHEQHLHLILGALRKNQFYGKLKKRAFWLSEVGHVINQQGIAVDPTMGEVWNLLCGCG